MAITLGEIKTQSRNRADQANSNFISDSELTTYINNSIAELHDLLAESYGSEYFVKFTEFQTTSGTDMYTLPEDFYELKGVDIKLDNQQYMNVPIFNFNERNRYSNFSAWDLLGVTNIRYRIVGESLFLTPTPDRAATIRMWYVPLASKLVNDSDTLNDYNAYSEYVIVDAAIKMMQKEESDVSVLFAQKQALEKRIRDKSQNRDASSPESVSDIYAGNNDWYFRRGGD